MTLVISLVFSVFFAQARTINITVTDGELVLTNPSSITVNYGVICYDHDGAATLVNNPSESLMAQKTKKYKVPQTMSDVDTSVACAGATASTQFNISSTQGLLCTGSMDYATASGVCSEGLEICNVPDNSTQEPSFCGSSGIFWLHAPKGNTFHLSSADQCFQAFDDGGQIRTDIAADSPMVYRYSAGSPHSPTTKWARHTSRATGSGEDTFTNYDHSLVGTSHGGVLCCIPDSNPVSYCQVNITTTNSAGYLFSPQFKGGSPF